MFLTSSVLSDFLPTPRTPHFRNDCLTIGALASEWSQLQNTQLTVAYPTRLGSRQDDGWVMNRALRVLWYTQSMLELRN